MPCMFGLHLLRGENLKPRTHSLLLQVPLDGFGSFCTSRSRRPAAGSRGRWQSEVPKGGGDPLLLLEGRERGVGSSLSSPEEKLLSPDLPPSPTPPSPKRRGRPRKSTKLEAVVADPAVVAPTLLVRGEAGPLPRKRRRMREQEEDESRFPAPITTSPAKPCAAAVAKKARASVLAGNLDDLDRCKCCILV
jgi:hypothetical protein